MALDALKEDVYEANMLLSRSGLVKMTWGNVSGVSRELERMVIKPSGVPYADLTPDQMVVLDFSGQKLEGGNPSTDSPTHLLLYLEYPELGGIAHSHSIHAVQFAQACRELPCLGTTHADHFMGPVPLTRGLTSQEMEAYEVNTGKVIIERFGGINPLEMPAVLVSQHGPFTWGTSPAEAVKNSIALDTCAEMALGTYLLNPEAKELPAHVLEKHYQRKHGPHAYYGAGPRTQG